MYALGLIAVSVGVATAVIAEGILLSGALQGKWSLIEGQRHPMFLRWFFSGLALVLLGVILAAFA